MLACTACGRAWNARALDPVWLTSATCPACGADLQIRARPIAATAPSRRMAPIAAPARPRQERLTGLGG
jgi:hypothetical protein